MLVFFFDLLPAGEKVDIDAQSILAPNRTKWKLSKPTALVADRSGAGAVFAIQFGGQLGQFVPFVGVFHVRREGRLLLMMMLLLLGGRRHRLEHVLHLVQQRGTLVEYLLRGDVIVGDFVVLVWVLIVGGFCIL